MKKITPAEIVIEMFGGIRPLAKQMNLAPSTVLRWLQRGGVIPLRHWPAIQELAKKKKMKLTLEDLAAGK